MLGNIEMKARRGVMIKRGQVHPALETIKERIEERRLAANLSRNEASRRAGLGLSYINDLMSDKSKNPGQDGLVKLAELLDTDVEYFLGMQDTPRKEGVIARAPIAIKPEPERVAASSIALYQIGLTDPDGFVALPESRRSPWPLSIDSASAYCVTVPDDTMAPRFRVGELVVVNPDRPVVHGGFAIVRLTDGRVAIREVVNIAPDVITVRSLSDQATREIPRSEVDKLHRIIGSCELA